MHGTVQGYDEHIDNDEVPCLACVKAHLEDEREHNGSDDPCLRHPGP